MDFKTFEKDIQDIKNEDQFIAIFPVFGTYPEFKKSFPPFSNLQLWKYIVLLYTEGSPLITKMGDVQKRKGRAMDLAGISGNDIEKLQLTNNRSEIVSKMISRYFRSNNNMLFESIVSGEEAFSNLMIIVRRPPENDEDSNSIGKHFQKAQDIRELVEKLKKEIANIQVDVFKENLSFSYSDDAVMGTMEKIALDKKSA